MKKSDYEELVKKLRVKQRDFDPAKGPYDPQSIYRAFNYSRLEYQEKNAEMRAAALDKLAQEVTNPVQLAKEQARENRYFDKSQEIIDTTIDNAERETCEANDIPLPGTTERGDGDEHNTPELVPHGDFIDQHSGGGNFGPMPPGKPSPKKSGKKGPDGPSL